LTARLARLAKTRLSRAARRAARAELGLPDELTAALEAKLSPDAGSKQSHRFQVEPD